MEEARSNPVSHRRVPVQVHPHHSSPRPFSSPPHAASIQDFLTDGSLARLCDELGRLTGVPIWLRDTDGQVIVPAPGEALPWKVVDPQTGAARAYTLVGRAYAPGADLFEAPIRTLWGEVGRVVMPADWGQDNPTSRRALERALTILTGTGAEAADGAILQRQRVQELDALFRLSSLLVKADDPQRLLQAALDLATEALGMDAGSVSVFEDDGHLRHRAIRGLSDAWLNDDSPISADGILRQHAIAGEVVSVEDVQHDERIADHARARAEGIASLMTTGLITGGRCAGLIRLYSRSKRSFSEREKTLLRSIADHAAMALSHAHLRQLRAQNERVGRQLRVAADVQRRMLPRRLPSFDRFDLAGKYSPSYDLGGDFYDLFDRRGRLGVAVGDVVGKGVPAALIMSAVRATLRAIAGEPLQLTDVITRVNRATFRDTLESEFVTLWCGLIDPVTLQIEYCSAGHDPALVFRPDGSITELGEGGMALGIDPEQNYTRGTHQLHPGDTLLVYTDGLPDATDFDGRKFGRERIEQTVRQVLATDPHATAQRLIEHLGWTLRQHCGVHLPHDDVTEVVVRVG